MKRSALILIAFATALSVSSCKKKYLCECREDQYEAYEFVNQTTSADDVKSKNRAAAEKACIDRKSEAIDENGYGHKTICSLK